MFDSSIVWVGLFISSLCFFGSSVGVSPDLPRFVPCIGVWVSVCMFCSVFIVVIFDAISFPSGFLFLIVDISSSIWELIFFIISSMGTITLGSPLASIILSKIFLE